MSAAPLHVHLIARDNGAGLTRDLELVREALAAQPGFVISVTAIGRRTGLRKRIDRLRNHLKGLWPMPWHRRYDINVMLEHVRPEYLQHARLNVLIPNPDWFSDRWKRRLPAFDAVLAKTHHAERLFAQMGSRVHFIGFTSPDRHRPEIPREPAFLHVAGRSGNKGTQPLIDLWRRHPLWPPLTVVWRRKRVEMDTLPDNVILRRDHIDDDALLQMQNGSRFHLCPSRTEGFGHSLVEALSVGAVTITLDAEPMNELVGNDRGILVRAVAAGTHAQATLYDAVSDEMAAAIERCRTMSEGEAEAIGERARAWFQRNDAAFGERLAGALRAVASEARRGA